MGASDNTAKPTQAQETLPNPCFESKNGVRFNGVSKQELLKLREALFTDYGISPLQICEASSFSMAMVVRAALGLSATGGRVCALVRDCLGGWVTLATIRHLANGGSEPVVVVVEPPAEQTEIFKAQIKPLEKMQIPVYDWVPSNNESDLKSLLESCHNSILGLSDLNNDVISPGMNTLISILNDLPTPLHCIEAPPGVDVDSGKIGNNPIFASSTLSMGAPLKGLYGGRTYVGRHYVCDTSISRELYNTVGLDLTPLFADQPVVQICAIE